MNNQAFKLCLLTLLAVTSGVLFTSRGNAQKNSDAWKHEIPKTWSDTDVAAFELPLADPANSPKHISSEYYYRMPVRPVYKGYPIYAPGKEPPGYLNRLKSLEPQIVFDAAKLKT